MAGSPAAAPLTQFYPAPIQPSPFAVCPQCGCQFEELRFYTIAQVASMFAVSRGTVNAWIASPDYNPNLEVRLWKLRANLVARVIDSRDLKRFIDAKLPHWDRSGQADDKANRQWRRARWQAQKGQAAGLATKRARKAAKLAENEAKSSENGSKTADSGEKQDKEGAQSAFVAPIAPDAGQGAGGVGFVEDDSVLEDKACSSKTMV